MAGVARTIPDTSFQSNVPAVVDKLVPAHVANCISMALGLGGSFAHSFAIMSLAKRQCTENTGRVEENSSEGRVFPLLLGLWLLQCLNICEATRTIGT